MVQILTGLSALFHFVLLMGLFFFSSRYGGTAHNGKIVGDHYFVGQHGGYVEVSQKIYMFSHWHVNVLVINLFVLALLGGILFLTRKQNTKSRMGIST